jgi:hypothetical protein
MKIVQIIEKCQDELIVEDSDNDLPLVIAASFGRV